MTTRTPKNGMTRSGHCAYPSDPEHSQCRQDGCTCRCHIAEALNRQGPSYDDVPDDYDGPL